jgi:hypothetical protein
VLAEDGEQLGLGPSGDGVVETLVDRRKDVTVLLCDPDELFDFVRAEVGLMENNVQKEE